MAKEVAKSSRNKIECIYTNPYASNTWLSTIVASATNELYTKKQTSPVRDATNDSNNFTEIIEFIMTIG